MLLPYPLSTDRTLLGSQTFFVLGVCANAEIVYAHALADLLFCPDAMKCASFLVFYGSVHTLVRPLRARTRVRPDTGSCFCVCAHERARVH